MAFWSQAFNPSPMGHCQHLYRSLLHLALLQFMVARNSCFTTLCAPDLAFTSKQFLRCCAIQQRLNVSSSGKLSWKFTNTMASSYGGIFIFEVFHAAAMALTVLYKGLLPLNKCQEPHFWQFHWMSLLTFHHNYIWWGEMGWCSVCNRADYEKSRLIQWPPENFLMLTENTVLKDLRAKNLADNAFRVQRDVGIIFPYIGQKKVKVLPTLRIWRLFQLTPWVFNFNFKT